MTESPSLLLQRAADAIEGCAGKATPGPWMAAGGFGAWRIKVENPVPDEDDVAYDITRVDDADWIASFSPAIAAPLVAWLRYAQVQYEVAVRRVWTYRGSVDNWTSESDRAALDFARLVLGVSAEGPERSDPQDRPASVGISVEEETT